MTSFPKEVKDTSPAGWLRDLADRFEHEETARGLRNCAAYINLLERPFTAVMDDVRRLSEASRWISVDERLPELSPERPRVDCLAAWDGGVAEMSYRCWYDAKTERGRAPRWDWQGRTSPWEVTHWMPLPKSPWSTK